MTTTKERHNFPEEKPDIRSPRNVTMVWPPLESAQTQSPVEPEPALPGALSRTMLVLLPRDPHALCLLVDSARNQRSNFGILGTKYLARSQKDSAGLPLDSNAYFF